MREEVNGAVKAIRQKAVFATMVQDVLLCPEKSEHRLKSTESFSGSHNSNEERLTNSRRHSLEEPLQSKAVDAS